MPLLGELGYTLTLPYGGAPVNPSTGYVRPELGPDFARGAPDPADCRIEEVFPLPGTTWQMVVARQPIDVWAVTGLEQLGREVRRFTAQRCGLRQCLAAVYDRDNKRWYCHEFGPPCGGEGEPACAPVPPDKWSVWWEDAVRGVYRVPADRDGAPIPVYNAGSRDLAGGGPAPILLVGAGLLAALLLSSRR